MNNRHRKTLAKVFDHPTRSDVAWIDIESLFKACGADVSQGAGSRVRVALNGVRATFHSPHPEKEVSKSNLDSIRDFLQKAGIQPNKEQVT